MPWNEQLNTRTLIIQRGSVSGRVEYRLHPYVRVTTIEGESFMEPLPGEGISLAHLGLVFHAIEIIDPPGSGQYGGGDTFLSRDSNECTIRLGADGAA